MHAAAFSPCKLLNARAQSPKELGDSYAANLEKLELRVDLQVPECAHAPEKKERGDPDGLTSNIYKFDH